MRARLTCAVFAAVFLILILPAPAPAANEGALYVKGAKREAAQALKAYREAVKVLDRTRRYSTQYGPAVGRWTKAAREAGWTWGRMDWLMAIMYRESRGSASAKNPTSTASGLGQFLAFWWDGSDPSIRAIFRKHRLPYPWNPFNARACLEHWWAAVQEVGTSPWAL